MTDDPQAVAVLVTTSAGGNPARSPIDKLKALAALEKASKIEENPLRDGFVAPAKSWSEAQGGSPRRLP
jgi:hypothetical protein